MNGHDVWMGITVHEMTGDCSCPPSIGVVDVSVEDFDEAFGELPLKDFWDLPSCDDVGRRKYCYCCLPIVGFCDYEDWIVLMMVLHHHHLLLWYSEDENDDQFAATFVVSFEGMIHPCSMIVGTN